MMIKAHCRHAVAPCFMRANIIRKLTGIELHHTVFYALFSNWHLVFVVGPKNPANQSHLDSVLVAFSPNRVGARYTDCLVDCYFAGWPSQRGDVSAGNRTWAAPAAVAGGGRAVRASNWDTVHPSFYRLSSRCFFNLWSIAETSGFCALWSA